jgi:hypothetical protein
MLERNARANDPRLCGQTRKAVRCKVVQSSPHKKWIYIASRYITVGSRYRSARRSCPGQASPRRSDVPWRFARNVACDRRHTVVPPRPRAGAIRRKTSLAVRLLG